MTFIKQLIPSAHHENSKRPKTQTETKAADEIFQKLQVWKP